MLHPARSRTASCAASSASKLPMQFRWVRKKSCPLVGLGQSLKRRVKAGRQVSVAEMHDREPAEIELIPQRHPGILSVEDMFRVGGGKGAEVRGAKLQRGTFLHQLDALLRDAVLMGQHPAAGGKNKLCFVVLRKPAQGVLCHVVGVAVGAED